MKLGGAIQYLKLEKKEVEWFMHNLRLDVSMLALNKHNMYIHACARTCAHTHRETG
jgi:hypothetical protein